MTYVNDTIKDINGDSLNDSVVNWDGVTGCCLKGFKSSPLQTKFCAAKPAHRQSVKRHLSSPNHPISN
jgi:hypothetical protein